MSELQKTRINKQRKQETEDPQAILETVEMVEKPDETMVESKPIDLKFNWTSISKRI
jgi:hypothetical protein